MTPFCHFCIFQYFENGNLWGPLSSTPGEDRHMRPLTFCTKFNSEQLLFKEIFYIMRVFGGVRF